MGNKTNNLSPTDQYIQNAQNNPIDFIKALVSVAQSSQDVQQGAKQLDANNQQLAQRNAYQKGVDDTLKKAGQAHAAEGLQAGLSPQDIANHPIMAEGQFQNNNQDNNQQQVAIDLLKRIINPQNVFTKQQILPDGSVQLGGLLDFLGTPLKNIALAQKITGNEQLQQSELQKNKIPLTQSEQATALAGYNTAQISAYNDAATRLTSQIDSLNKQFAEEQKTISPLMVAGATLTGQPTLTPNMVRIQGAIKDLQNRLFELNKRGPAGLVNPAQNVPTYNINKIKSSAPKGASHYSPSTGKYYDSDGKEIK